MEIIKKTIPVDRLEDIINVFGTVDGNIKIIEKGLEVNIFSKDNEILITGISENVEKAAGIIGNLLKISKMNEEISKQNVNYLVQLATDGELTEEDNIPRDYICMTARGRKVQPKTKGQKQYVDMIKNHDIVFSIGPAGTGKTFLAVAMAVVALREKKVNRIILTRPAVEAGEKLGFLPGDLQHKVDPYLRPLYDGLYEIMGVDMYQKYFEKGIIEIAPLAYMRGRTLDDAFIILDEAQNTSIEQMKMFLTRMGFGSKMVINGDITQMDLPEGKRSGLREAVRILKDVNDIAFIFMTERDVVRHELVKKIIKAFDQSDGRR